MAPQARRRLPFDPAIFLATNEAGRKIVTLQKGQTLFAQGSAATSVFYLRKGKIKMTVTSKQGKEAVVAIHNAGDFFGEGCLIGQSLRLARASAMTDCIVMRVDKRIMLKTLDDQPGMSTLFTFHLLTRNTRVEEDLVDQLFNSSEKRLARILLQLANYGEAGGPAPIEGKFSQEMLAGMVGTTRSRVSYFMNKFRKLGYIDYNGTIEVHSSLLGVVLQD